MKTIVCQAPGRLVAQEAPEPIPAPGEALVQVRRIGICGTDLHAYRGDQPYFTYPRVLGHELAAEVLDPGASTALRPGDAVVVVPYLTCGHCSMCRQGRTNCCVSLELIGVHRDGGMCERLAMPASHLLPADSLTLDQMATVECLSIGAHAVSRARVLPGEQVLVIGAGPIGMGAAQAARNAGAEVIVADTDEGRLRYCRDRLAVPHTVVATDQAADAVRDLTGGCYPSVVFEATGNPASMTRAFTLVAHGGRYVLIGLVDADISFNDPEFHKRELSLLSSRNATAGDLRTVIDTIRAGRLETDSFVTHRVRFDQLPESFEEWTRPGGGADGGVGLIKAMGVL